MKKYYIDFAAEIEGNGESPDTPARSVQDLHRMAHIKPKDRVYFTNNPYSPDELKMIIAAVITG